MLEFVMVKLPNVSHIKISKHNYHMVHREIFHKIGSYNSHPFLPGVGKYPKAGKQQNSVMINQISFLTEVITINVNQR